MDKTEILHQPPDHLELLAEENEWISSLKDRTITVLGLVSFYLQKPAMRILEKKPVTLPDPSNESAGL